MRWSLVVVLAFVGCTPFGATTTTSTAPVPDAGPVAVDAGSEDASADAGVTCASEGTFCDNFEKIEGSYGYGSAWKLTYGATPGNPRVDDAPGGGRALHVILKNVQRSFSDAIYVPMPPGPTGRYRVTYRLYVQDSSVDFARLGGVVFRRKSSLGDNHTHMLNVWAGKFRVLDADEDGQQHEPEVQPSPLDRWQAIVVEVEPNPGGGVRRRARVDDVEVTDLVASTFDETVVEATFGAFETSANGGGLDVWIDDVVLRSY